MEYSKGQVVHFTVPLKEWTRHGSGACHSAHVGQVLEPNYTGFNVYVHKCVCTYVCRCVLTFSHLPPWKRSLALLSLSLNNTTKALEQISYSQRMVWQHLRVPKTLSGSPHGQNYFHDDTKRIIFLFYSHAFTSGQWSFPEAP